jgi:four helix bundle protein
MANISEGFDSHSNPEFVQFLYYSLRSASELQSHLYVALDQGYISQSRFEKAYDRASQAKSMIFSFVRYLRGRQKSTGNTVRLSNIERRTSNLELP